MNWLEYFTDLALLVSKKSKDPSTKVGAVIIDTDNRILSTGYNGAPQYFHESYMSFKRPLKYHLTIHAEMNAILFARQSLKDCALITTHSPCVNCLKHAFGVGITHIFYADSSINTRGDDIEKAAQVSPEEKEAIIRLMRGYMDRYVINTTTFQSYGSELSGEHSGIEYNHNKNLVFDWFKHQNENI